MELQLDRRARRQLQHHRQATNAAAPRPAARRWRDRHQRAAAHRSLNNPGRGWRPGCRDPHRQCGDDSAVTQVCSTTGQAWVAFGNARQRDECVRGVERDLADMAAGSYTLTAQATDDQGTVSVSAPVSVTITEPNSNPQAGLYFN